MPQRWEIQYDGTPFFAKLTPFKHTGMFPEQHLHWDWMIEKIKNQNRQLNILNIFGYTGIASLIAAKYGAKVTHLDASAPAVVWARDNQQLAGLSDMPIRL